MDHPALDPLMGELIGDCQAACAASDLAAETAGGDPELCATHLRETARLIIQIELLLQHHFLPPTPPVPVFADPIPPSSPVPIQSSEPVPAPLTLLPADPILCTLTNPADVSLLVHEIRGIRSVFVLGAELDLKPTESENLFNAAAQMTRRLEPLIREFFAGLGGANPGELKVES